VTKAEVVISASTPDVSIVLVTWNSEGTIERCLTSIECQTAGILYEIVIVDNASIDRTCEVLESEFTNLRVIQTGGNLGFAPAMNIAIQKAKGKFVLLLNPDCWLKNDAIGEMIAFYNSHPNVGCIGPRLTDDDGATATFGARDFPSLAATLYRQFGLQQLFAKSKRFGCESLASSDLKTAYPVPCLTGAAMFIPRSVLDEVGLLNADLPMYFEDLDYCARIACSGRLLYYLPAAHIGHSGGKSFSVSPVRRLLLGMENGEAPFLYFRRYRSLIQAALFRLIIAVSAVFRLAGISLLRVLLLLRRDERTQAFVRQQRLRCFALLAWAFSSKEHFYGLVRRQFGKSGPDASALSAKGGSCY